MEINSWLIRPDSDTEIREAVFSIGQDRAPGYDEFSGASYHQLGCY